MAPLRLLNQPDYRMIRKYVLPLAHLLTALLCSVLVFANDDFDNDNGAIKGKVTTQDGSAAAAVSVQLKGTKKAATTDEDGYFVVKNVKPGTYELLISLVGYEPLTQTVTVEENKTTAVIMQLGLSKAQLQEVTVTTARNKFTSSKSDYVAKMPLKNLENPQVYTTITKELLADQLVFSVDDALRNAPGLQKMWEATGRGGDGGAYYNARGFIVQSQLRNGIAGNVTSRIDAANLESVEVIKGPSATLFGSTLTSYGGLINRVTKKPYEKFGGEIAYSNGSYGFNRVSADINTPLDSARKVLLRVNGAYNYEGSFQDNGFDKMYSIAPSLTYKVNDQLSFNFDAEFYQGKNTGKQIIFFYYPTSQLNATNPAELGIDYKRSYSSNSIYQTSQNTNFFAQMNYKFSGKWVSQTNFTSTHSFSDGPYPYYYVMPNSVALNDPAATGADYLVRADQSTASSSLNVLEIQQNFMGNFNIGALKNRVVLGLDYFHQHSDQLFYGLDFDTIPKNGSIPTYGHFSGDKLDSALRGGKPWSFPYRYNTNTYSAYVSDVINVTDNLMALAAVRVDHFYNQGSYDETTAIYSGSYKQTAFSPKFGLVFQPVHNKLSLFANYQNSFTNKTGTDYAGKTFKPEHANQVEGGVKTDLFGGKLTGTLSYYYIKVKDVVRTYAANPLYNIQDGTQESKGVEAEIIASPFAGMNIVAGYAYNDSKYTRADADVQGRRPGTAMSPTTVNLWLSYKLPQGSLKGLGFGFGGNYASSNKVINSASMGVFTLPSYTVLNATIFYDQPKFRIGLKADNLTNKEYWIGYSTMNPQKLRSVAGSIAFKF